MYKSIRPVNRKISLLLLLLIFSFSFFTTSKIQACLEEKNRIESYRNALISFQKSEVEDVLIGLREKKKIILYVGRETCPYCVEFLPKFTDLLQKINTSNLEHFERIYIDSTNSDSDLILKVFRKKYLIDSVPAILFFSDGEYKSMELPLKDDFFDYQKIEQELNEYSNCFREER